MSVERIAKNLGSSFCKHLGKLVFRRVSNVFDDCRQKVQVKFYSDDLSCYVAGEKDVFTEQEEIQNVERLYSEYSAQTTQSTFRENEPAFAFRKAISFHTRNMCDIEMENLSFKLRKIGEEVPKIQVRPGDLVAGFVICRKEQPVYIKWFICSEQFLRMWTIIMYGEEHQTFQKKLEEDSTHPMGPVYKWLMSGNRLCTNNYLKWSLACINEGIPVDERERRKRYFRYRSEDAAKRYIHLYACIVQVCVYLQFPEQENLPKTLDQGPQLKEWNLPADFKHKLIDMFDVEVSNEILQVQPVHFHDTQGTLILC